MTPDDGAFSRDLAEGRAVDLFAASGGHLERMPHVLRVLLENVVRCDRSAEAQEQRAAIIGWLKHRTSSAEIAFKPARVLMHDTTCGPALVDIAGMRDRLAEAGLDPSTLNPVLRSTCLPIIRSPSTASRNRVRLASTRPASSSGTRSGSG